MSTLPPEPTSRANSPTTDAGFGGSGLSWQGLLGAMAAALFVRFVVYLLLSKSVEYDSATYDLLARNLLDHGVYSVEETPPLLSTMYRPPGYPAFLAALFTLCGHRFGAIVLAQIGLSLVSILLLGRAAEKRSPGLGAWVIWALALCPFDAAYCVSILSELLCGTLLVGAMVAWLSLPGWRAFIVGGALLGLSTLVRDIYIALIPFTAGAWLLFGEGARLTRIKQAAVLALVGFLVVAPWTARNYAVSGRFVPTSSGRLGFSLWLGAWATKTAEIKLQPDGSQAYADKAFLHGDVDRAAVARANSLPQAQSDLAFKQLFKERFAEEPGRVIGRWFVRAPQLWLGTRYDIFLIEPRLFPYGSKQWVVLKSVFWGLNTLYVAFGFAGIALAWRRRSELRLFAVPIVFTALVYLPLNSFENRYAQPIYPLLAMFAAYAVREAWLRFRRSRAGTGRDSGELSAPAGEPAHP